MRLYSVQFGIASLLLVALSGCHGDKENGSGSTAPSVVSPAINAISGVAQGPLISGSTVTAQEVDASLNQTSTGKQYTYTISSDLGAFSVASTFSSPYIELSATGKYFDEVANAASTGPVTLKSWNASSDTDLNVNILTTLAHQRIKTLMTGNAPLSFTAARQQAEREVLAAFNIRDYNQYSFSSINLAKSRDIDNILAAISSLFLFGNTYGQVSALMANFQTDIADNGVVDNTATQTALINSANSAIGVNPATVASNLTSKYSSAARSFLASDISNWLDQDGDKVIGKFKFQGVQATVATPFTFPVYTVGASDNGASYSIANGNFRVNGGVSTASATVHTGDSIVVTRLPVAHDSSSTFLQSTLQGRTIPPAPTINVARYDFNPFAAAGSLTTARTNSTATVLQNGQVLVAGGLVAGTSPAATDAAELYNPVTNQWTSAASMKVKRVGHTATLLNNGQVLVVGGDVAGAAGTAELYDPTTNTWTKMAASTPAILSSPAYGHIYHTATLLNNGQVLIVGGITYSPASKASTGATSPELYNPATGLWTALSNMNTPGLRYYHTATLLPNNKVFIAGGINGNIAIAGAELFDPAATAPANPWTSVSAGMFDARYSHSATLLQTGKVLIAGGINGNIAIASAELFDPAATAPANPWTKMSPLKTGRFGHIAQLLSDGNVLVAGGAVNSNGTYLSSAELYDQTTGLWAPNGNLSYARDAFGAVMLTSGKVLMAGGNGVKAAETFK